MDPIPITSIALLAAAPEGKAYKSAELSLVKCLLQLIGIILPLFLVLFEVFDHNI